MKKFIIRFVLLLPLGACGTTIAATNPVAPADIAAIEEGVTIADTLALNYMRLPLCPIGAPACSAATTRQSIKSHAQQAHDAARTLRMSSAAGAPVALALAQAALEALEASIPAASPVAPTAN